MATGDQGGAAPKGATVFGFPLWMVAAGVGGVVLLLWYRRSHGGASASTGQPLVPGVATDPNTGFPIDSLTGLPFITSQPTTTTDLATWAQNAMKALVGAGYSPALASQALYDYQAGNQLNAQESDAVNKALGLVGFAPESLPFFGNIPPTPGNYVYPKAPFITTTAWQKLGTAARKLWAPITTPGGAHGYIPTGFPLPTGSTWGKGYIAPAPSVTPHPIFAPVPTTTVNGSKLTPTPASTLGNRLPAVA